MIQMNNKNFGTLCICALRYCDGRQTYMPDTVRRIVQEHFEYLDDRDLRIMALDAKESNDPDTKAWGETVTAELKRRAKND